jgi:methylated-DNA-protein-cysteine methyltransferase-like protein
MALTEFSLSVISTIKKVPKGKMATYGQIAALAGKPHGARGVSWILHSCTKSHGLPWFRVLGAGGKISMPRDSRGFDQQKKKLENEGVEFLTEITVNMKSHQWKKFAKKEKLPGKAYGFAGS